MSDEKRILYFPKFSKKEINEMEEAEENYNEEIAIKVETIGSLLFALESISKEANKSFLECSNNEGKKAWFRFRTKLVQAVNDFDIFWFGQ